MVSIGGSSLVKSVTLRVIGDGGDANRMLDEITAKAEALKNEHPELTVSIDRAKAQADAILVKAQMRAVLESDPIKVPVELDTRGGLGLFLKSMVTKGGWGQLASLIPGVGGAGIGGAGLAAGAAGTGGSGAASGFALLGTPGGLLGGAAALWASTPLIVTLLGGLVGGAGAAGALKLASTANTNLTALQATVTSAQAQLASAQQQQKFYPSAANAASVATAQAALNQANAAANLFSKQNAPALGLYAAMQNVGSAGSAALITALTGNATRQVQERSGHMAGLETVTQQIGGSSFINGLDRIMNQIPAFIRTIGPQLGAMFRASLPYLELFVRSLEGLATRVFPAITSALQHFQRFLPDMYNIFGAISIAIGAVIRTVGKLAEYFAEFVQWLPKAGESVIDWFTELPKRIWNDAVNFEKSLFDLGADIIGGFLRGIEHAWSDVTSTISGLFDHLPSIAKKILGISSPSRVMQEIGRNTADGFRIGLTQSALGVGLTVGGTGGGAAGGGLRLQVTGGGAGLDHLFFEWLKQGVRLRGGGTANSVQKALGQAH